MKQYYLRYIIALLIFGSNGVVASHIPLNSYEIVLMRTAIGIVMLWSIFFLTKQQSTVGQYKKEFIFLALSGIMMGLNWLSLYEAFQQIGVGLSILACYCGPALVMVLSPVLFREKLTWSKLLGFAVVLVGMVLCNGEIVVEGHSAWGIFCGAMACLTMATLIVLNKKAAHITGLENTAWEMTFAFVTVAIFVGCKQGFGFVSTIGPAWPWVLTLGIINTGLGCYLYFSAIGRLPVQSVSILGYLEPLSGVVLSMIFLQEIMTPLQMVGAVCILGGAAFAECYRPKSMAKT
ncbi:MAG: EamA family transporter [Clostridiales bacterium]|nr:EamA family transporter [Candidatus Cacconaster stercorequi]